MFSLIVTLISIALVAALALATLYYGGPVFNQGAARAHAAKIAAQGQQIQGAAELYKADNGEYPISLAELVAQDYLKSVPVAAAQEQVLINNALAAASWVMVAPKTPVFALTGVSEATCKAVNLGSYGVEGILKTARQTNRVQCYGTSTGSLMIVQAKSPADLVAASTHPAAVIQVGTVLPAPVPAADSTDTSDAGWLVAPGAGESVTTPPAGPKLAYLENGAQTTAASFASTAVGESTSITVELKNIGGTPAVLDTPAVSVPSPFIIDSTTCNGVSLAPSASCSVVVKFTPTAIGSVSGASYTLTARSSNVTAEALALSGTATVALTQSIAFVDDETSNAIAGIALNFGRYAQLSAYPNAITGTKGFAIVNTSNTPLTLGALPVEYLSITNTLPPVAANATPLAIDAYFCSNTTLAPGESCPIYVEYTAWNPGQFNLNFSVTNASAVTVGTLPISLTVSSTISTTPVECGNVDDSWVYLYDTVPYGGYASAGDSCV